MGGLRIFVSSTMLDLANERQAVVDKIQASNYEAVNAESITPNGESSWARIVREVEACDLFVLILGESYGWIPTTGPHAGRGLSVTELEYEEAIRCQLPILAFLRPLGYAAPRTGEEAEKRDAFRARVQDWNGGVFRQEFRLAKDLGELVGRAVAGLLADSYRTTIAKRRRTRPPSVGSAPRPTTDRGLQLPDDLVESVRAGNVVPFLGAGVSMPAGMPSPAAFTDAIIERLVGLDPGYNPPGSGTLLNAVATDLALLAGKEELAETVRLIVTPPWPMRPTFAHETITRHFRQILTTNYDTLLEATLAGQDRAVVALDLTSDFPPDAIVKLHGTLDVSGSLVLTEQELVDLPKHRAHLWSQTIQLLRQRRLLAMGTGLRDPSIVALLDAVGDSPGGWAVLVDPSRSDRARLALWGLEVIEGTADEFAIALERALENDARGARQGVAG